MISRSHPVYNLGQGEFSYVNTTYVKGFPENLLHYSSKLPLVFLLTFWGFSFPFCFNQSLGPMMFVQFKLTAW